MARKNTQALRDLRRYLEAGKTVSEALACAGIPPEKAESALAELTEEHKDNVAALIHLSQSRLLTAVSVLEEIAQDGEDESSRVQAAKALVALATQTAQLISRAALPESRSISKNQKSLWDYK